MLLEAFQTAGCQRLKVAKGLSPTGCFLSRGPVWIGTQALESLLLRADLFFFGPASVLAALQLLPRSRPPPNIQSTFGLRGIVAIFRVSWRRRAP